MPAMTETSARIKPPRALDRAGAMFLTVLVHAGLLALLILLKGQPALIQEAQKRLTLIAPTPPKPPPPKPVLKKPVAAKVVQDAPSPKLPEPPKLPDLAAPAAVAPVVPVLTLPAPAGDASSGAAAGGNGTAARGVGGSRGAAGEDGTGAGWGTEMLYTGHFRRPARPSDFNPPPNTVPGAPKSGWGQIICRTAPKDRVVECRPHAEFPAGSGFSEAMRKASHRFRVYLEDKNGEPMIGGLVLVSLNFLEPKRF